MHPHIIRGLGIAAAAASLVMASAGAAAGAGAAIAAGPATPWASSGAPVVDIGSGTVTPIRVATNKALTPIKVNGRYPEAIAITPGGKTAYIADGYSSRMVTPIRTATNKALKPVTSGLGPWAIAVTPDGKTAYVANERPYV